MPFRPSNPSEDFSPVSWDELTRSQQRVAKAVGFLAGPGEFTRPNLQEAASESNNLSVFIDQPERLLTSLKYTTLLNKLVEYEYLVKIRQGGQNVRVIDFGPEGGSQSVPIGAEAELRSLAEQALERHGVSLDVLEDVDLGQAQEVVSRVNQEIGEDELGISADPTVYGLPTAVYELIISSSIEDITAPSFRTELFHTYPTIDYSIPNHQLEATVDSINSEVASFIITVSGEYIDEAHPEMGEVPTDIQVNDAYDVVYLPDEEVRLIRNRPRSEIVKQEVEAIFDEFLETAISIDEWRGIG